MVRNDAVSAKPSPAKDQDSRPEIMSIGTVNVDLLLGPVDHWPQPGTETVYPDYAMRIGGGGGIFAACLKSLGADQRLLVNVGNDEMGNWLRSEFGDLAKDWEVSETVTAVTIGITHPDKERTFLSNQGHSSVFNADMVARMLDGRDLNGVMVLLVGNYLMPELVPDCDRLLADLKARGALVALDTAWPTGGWSPSVRKQVDGWLKSVDVLLINDAEAAGILDIAIGEFGDDLNANMTDLARRLPDHGCVVVKRGKQGAVALCDGVLVSAAPSGDVAVIDTVGAGDCFNAGFLLARQRGADLQQALGAGIDVAGKTIASNPRRYPEISDLAAPVQKVLTRTPDRSSSHFPPRISTQEQA